MHELAAPQDDNRPTTGAEARTVGPQEQEETLRRSPSSVAASAGTGTSCPAAFGCGSSSFPRGRWLRGSPSWERPDSHPPRVTCTWPAWSTLCGLPTHRPRPQDDRCPAQKIDAAPRAMRSLLINVVVRGPYRAGLVKWLVGPRGLTEKHNSFARCHAPAEIAGAFTQGAPLTGVEQVTWGLNLSPPNDWPNCHQQARCRSPVRPRGQLSRAESIFFGADGVRRSGEHFASDSRYTRHEGKTVNAPPADRPVALASAHRGEGSASLRHAEAQPAVALGERGPAGGGRR